MSTTIYFHRDGRPCEQAVRNENARLGRATITERDPCSRCGGTGIFRWWTVMGQAGGTCFGCAGAGGRAKDRPVYTAAKLAKLEAGQAKRDAKRAAKAQARVDAANERGAARAADMETAHPGLATRIAAAVEDEVGGRFMESMAQAIGEFGGLTEAQALAAERALARHAEERTLPHVGTVGKRETFDTEVVHVAHWQGTYGTTWLHVLRDTATGATLVYKGSRYLLACHVDEARGKRVRLKATVAEHGERNGKRQTVLKRPASIEVAKTEEAGA